MRPLSHSSYLKNIHEQREPFGGNFTIRFVGRFGSKSEHTLLQTVRLLFLREADAPPRLS